MMTTNVAEQTKKSNLSSVSVGYKRLWSANPRALYINSLGVDTSTINLLLNLPQKVKHHPKSTDLTPVLYSILIILRHAAISKQSPCAGRPGQSQTHRESSATTLWENSMSSKSLENKHRIIPHHQTYKEKEMIGHRATQ